MYIKKVKREALLAIGLIRCEGKLSEKSSVLYDVLMPPEQFTNDESIPISHPNLLVFINLMLEWSLIYDDLLRYHIKPNSEQYNNAMINETK